MCLAHFAKGQNALPSLNEVSFDLKYCGGSIYKHTKKVHIDPPPYSQEIEFSVSHRTFGKRNWERINNCPVPSINFCYSNYGDALGNAFSFYPGIEWALLRRKKINWTMKVGGGIGLASKRWNRSDTLNNYLGSTLNNFTTFNTAVSYPITKNVELQAGGRFSHISNGAFRAPNFGINLFSGFLGVNYYPAGQQKRVFAKAKKATKRSYNFGLRSAIAWSENPTPNGPLYPIYSQSFLVSTTLLKKHNFFIGADISYNTKALAGLKYASNTENMNWASTNTSIFVGAELLYGRVGLPLQVGIYTKKIDGQNAQWYQKLGFQYYIYQNQKSMLKKLFVGPLLKSNKINADYIEFCVGAMF